MTEPELLTIGQIATATGITVSAVRYYDELGVIASATRVGGKRRFHPETIGTVSFIRRAQEVGFSLDEIHLILDDDAGGWREMVEAKREELIERRQRLDVMIEMVTEVGDCGCEVVAACPVLA